jgi:hypothetical protein
MNDEYPKISVVILNWQQWTETLNCLESVLANCYPNFECIVVDNGSSNDSHKNIISWLMRNDNVRKKDVQSSADVKKQRSHFVYFNKQHSRTSVNITVMQTGLNLGYSGGNNVGIEKALMDGSNYVLILNSDTAVKQNFIWEITRAAIDSHAAIIGGLIKDCGGQTILQAGESLLRGILSFGLQNPKLDKGLWWQTEIVNGSAMMMSREMLTLRKQKLGFYLHPHFFLYCEEIEIGFWCKKNGFKSIISKNSEVVHAVGGSSTIEYKPFVFYYLTRNRIIIAREYLSGIYLYSFYLCFLFLKIIRIFYYYVTGKKQISHAIKAALVDGIKNIRGPKSQL